MRFIMILKIKLTGLCVKYGRSACTVTWTLRLCVVLVINQLNAKNLAL